jgi:Na+/H+-dicarboxylate symporter
MSSERPTTPSPHHDEAFGDKNKTETSNTPEYKAPAIGCGILAKYPLLSILSFAAVGIALGIGLSAWEPDDSDDKSTVLQWVGLIGDLYIRALKCVVLPLVFVNVILSVVDMMSVGKAGRVGWKTIGWFLLTTVCAATLGVISIVCFKGLFEEGNFEQAAAATIELGCNDKGSVLVHNPDGSVGCTTNVTEGASNKFVILDVDSVFVTKSTGPANDISLSDTVYQGVFAKLVTDNMVGAFVEANFAGVVAFAIAIGFALGRVVLSKKIGMAESYVVRFLKELDQVLLLLINWIIAITPFAVLSLICKAIGKQSDLKESFGNVGYLVAATISAMAVHFLFIYVGFFIATTRSNPWSYFKHLIPAQTTGTCTTWVSWGVTLLSFTNFIIFPFLDSQRSLVLAALPPFQ